VPQIRLYTEWLERRYGLQFDDYNALWRWSVTELEAFWQSVWDYFDIQSPTPYRAALARNQMPGAQWFPGAQVNYGRQIFRHADAASAAGLPALIAGDETGAVLTLQWPQLRQRVHALAAHLRAQGVQPGDRVVAYMPNTAQAAIALLATVSIGAVWSICAPDMGINAIVDRFSQIEPKVLIACNGIRYGGREQERLSVIDELRRRLPSLEHLIVYRKLNTLDTPVDATDFDAASAGQMTCSESPSGGLATAPALTDANLDLPWLAFDHPLWIVYSSGTTGLPKPIVHTHGSALVNGMMHRVLHYDIGCSYHPNSLNERFMWYSSTGWVMWNSQISALLNGTTCVIYDGSPGGPRDAPDWSVLWRFAAQQGVTFFGAGAAFYQQCVKADLQLDGIEGLASVRALGSTGSPLSAQVQRWGSEQFRALYDAQSPDCPDIWWCNIAGGTDAGSFVGGHRELPMVEGGLQCRFLGVAIEAWNEAGESVIDEVGELVVTQPLPSMPLFLWGDANFERYRDSYFDRYPPGRGRRPGGGKADPQAGAVWRHGDWIRITPQGACVIYGRSDTTLNRSGLRMGSSELYRAVERLEEIQEAMVVDLEYLDRPSWMPLFVKLRTGVQLDEALLERIRQAIRTDLSPRFIPDAIFAVPDIPHTLSGKKQELPIRKLLLGMPAKDVINREAMANPECLDWYLSLARSRAVHQAQAAQAPCVS
jgi:acetoacetyl-CoA synthetase